MGLLPANEVKEHFVFTNQNQPIEDNGVLHGPVTKVTIADVVNLMGPRVPAYATSQKKFKIATIIVTSTFLSDAEMSFYDYFSSRAELREPVNVREGLLRYQSFPFYLSTGGRAEISTSLAK
jgi:hypothetical protein